MKHLSWKYRRRRNAQEMKEFREAQSRRARMRWALYHAELAGGPIRETRVTEIVIRDSQRARTTIVLRRDPTRYGWGRARVEQDGVRIGKGRMGVGGIATLLAKWLE